MWKNIRDSWKLLKNEAERDIMRQYASSGELHTKLVACNANYLKKANGQDCVSNKFLLNIL